MMNGVGRPFTVMAAALLAMALGAAPDARAATDQSARELIVTATERFLDALTANRERLQTDTTLPHRLAEELVTPLVDFEGVARHVLARHWRTASGDQRERFTRALRGMLVNFYTAAMVSYADRIVAHADRLKFLPERPTGSSEDALVRMEVRLREGLSASVDYRMRRVNGSWRVRDVRVEGVSMALTYRRSVDEAVRRDGLDDTIAAMEKKAAPRAP